MTKEITMHKLDIPSHDLTELLGLALSQTFSELQDMRSQTSSLTEEFLLLKLNHQTVLEENQVLRDKKREVEEYLRQENQKKFKSLQEQKQLYKKEKGKVASVLQKALKELKKTKSNLEEIQKNELTLQMPLTDACIAYHQENDHLAKEYRLLLEHSLEKTEDYKEALELSIEENIHLAEQYQSLLHLLFQENSKDELSSFKQKQELELGRLKKEFQSVLQNTLLAKERTLNQKFDTEKNTLITKLSTVQQALLTAQQKLGASAQQNKESIQTLQLLEEKLQKKEEECSSFKNSIDNHAKTLEGKILEWEEKFHLQEVKLREFLHEKEEYDKMKHLISTIQSYTSPAPKENALPRETPITKKQKAVQQDLFDGLF